MARAACAVLARDGGSAREDSGPTGRNTSDSSSGAGGSWDSYRVLSDIAGPAQIFTQNGRRGDYLM